MIEVVALFISIFFLDSEFDELILSWYFGEKLRIHFFSTHHKNKRKVAFIYLYKYNYLSYEIRRARGVW